jgi:NAD(P)-dependent dehydrogenase (short-subunit alcohol dehydrogenase family)
MATILDKFSLANRTVLITGAARGLGLAFATSLAQAGANIAALDLADKPREDFESLTTWGGKMKYYK